MLTLNSLRPTHFQPNSEWSKLRALYDSDPTLPGAQAVSTGTSLSNGSTTATEAHPTATATGPPTISLPPAAPLIILERHRHRYEVNPAYIDTLSKHDLHFVGKDDSGQRMEIMELKEHPWYVGVQYHPEYLSRVLRPSKPYLGFVAASSKCLADMTSRRARSASMNGLVDGAM